MTYRVQEFKAQIITKTKKTYTIIDPEVEGGEFQHSIEVPLKYPLLAIRCRLFLDDLVKTGAIYRDENGVLWNAISAEELELMGTTFSTAFCLPKTFAESFKAFSEGSTK